MTFDEFRVLIDTKGATHQGVIALPADQNVPSFYFPHLVRCVDLPPAVAGGVTEIGRKGVFVFIMLFGFDFDRSFAAESFEMLGGFPLVDTNASMDRAIVEDRRCGIFAVDFPELTDTLHDHGDGDRA